MKIDIISLIYFDQKGDKNLTKQLLRESSFLGDAIAESLRKETFFDCRRMNFICKEDDIQDRISQVYSIAEMDIPFSREYFSMDVENRQKYLADIFRIATQIWCEKKKWNYNLFKAVIDKVEKNNYTFERYFQNIKCKNGEMTAKLFGIQSINCMDLYIDIFNKKTFEKREFIFSASPHILEYGYDIGNLTWNGDTISLLNENKKLVSSIKV